MFRRFLASCALALSLVLIASPAQADWYEASSDHFVIYADDSPKDLQVYAENLEKYHSAMEFLLRRKTETPSPSNRLVIFVVGNERELQKVAGGNSKYIGGFYVPRAGGSRAFVQDIRNKSGYPDFTTVVLLHEYAHHVLISNNRFPMPRWMSEGGAEFFAAASFEKDGSVQIGRPAQHRGAELAYADNVTVEELLDQELYEKNKGKRYDAFYGRSWLLYHYLTFSEERTGQLQKYMLAVANGTPSLEAGKTVFGDLSVLEGELRAYARQKRMYMLPLSADKLQPSPVTMRKLSVGEGASMPLRIRSQRGVNDEQAKELLVEARAVAAKYPDDAAVMSVLAEAEYDAGNDAEAIAAAEKAIALDPSLTNPYVQKGYAMFRIASEADDLNAAYKAAMKPFQQLNALETLHPLPLIYYYRSFVERGIEPPEDAKLALENAAMMAPFDQALWFNVARMQMSEGKIAIAMSSLRPIAADPHGGSLPAEAQALLEMLAKIPEGQALNARFDAEEEEGESDADASADAEDEAN